MKQRFQTNRIQIGSSFNGVPGSGSGSRFTIRTGSRGPKMIPKNRKKSINFIFQVPSVLFWGLKGSSVAWTTAMNPDPQYCSLEAVYIFVADFVVDYFPVWVLKLLLHPPYFVIFIFCLDLGSCFECSETTSTLLHLIFFKSTHHQLISMLANLKYFFKIL